MKQELVLAPFNRWENYSLRKLNIISLDSLLNLMELKWVSKIRSTALSTGSAVPRDVPDGVETLLCWRAVLPMELDLVKQEHGLIQYSSFLSKVSWRSQNELISIHNGLSIYLWASKQAWDLGQLLQSDFMDDEAKGWKEGTIKRWS